MSKIDRIPSTVLSTWDRDLLTCGFWAMPVPYSRKLFGILVTVNWMWVAWFATALLISLVLGDRQAEAIILFCPLALFCSLCVHELGHLWALGKDADKVERVHISLIYGMVKQRKDCDSKRLLQRPKKHLGVALSGCLMNLLLAGILFIASFAFRASWWFDSIIELQLLLCLNLLPVFPLDGGRALHASLRLLAPSEHTVASTSFAGVCCGALAGWGFWLFGEWLGLGVIAILVVVNGAAFVCELSKPGSTWGGSAKEKEDK